MLQSQHDALALDFLAAQGNTEEVHRQLKRALSGASDRENELREKVRENSEAHQEIQRLKEEVSHLKRESSSLGDSLETERRGQHKQLTDLQSRDADLAKFQREVESRENTINKLHEQVASVKEQLREAQAESDLRAEQLRNAKANSDRVLSTIEQLERSAENDKRERVNCERKLLEAENTNTTVSRLKSRVHELESGLSVAHEESRALSHAKSAADDQHQRHVQELESSKKRVQSLESRIESILQEKSTFVDEISDTRRKIAAAKELAEEERQKRIRSEASVDALRRVGDEKRFYVDEFSAKTQEIESRQLQAEEEKRSLRIKINELKSVCDEKDSAFVAEASDRLKLEKDIKQLKAALQKRSQELSNSASYSSMLRSEGRNARKQVLEAVGQIREMVNIVRIDAHSVGVEIRSPEAKTRSPAARSGSSQGGSGGAEFDEESLSLGLSEALGINDLSGSLEALRSAIAFVRSAPKNRIEVETTSRRLEAECASLRKELGASEAKKNELASQYKHELHTMQLQITEVRRTDSKNPHLVHQIAVLEASLKQERDRKERLSGENEQLRAKLEHQSHDQQTVQSRTVKVICQ
jgi:chromosome segregation ATPase